MKKRHVLSVALAMMAAGHAAAQEYTMQVVLTDGTTQSFVVGEISEINWAPLEYKATLRQLPDLLHSRINPLLITEGDRYVLLGGHTDGFRRDGSVEVYENGAWSDAGVSVYHDFGCQVRMKDGRTLLLGGTSSGSGVGQTSDAHIYDPATGQITQIAGMNMARTMCTAACLKDGKVLVAGNWYSNGSTLELFDPETESFTLLDASLPNAVTEPIIIPTADGGAALFARDNAYGSRVWNGDYYKLSPDGSVTSVHADGWEGLTPCAMESHYDFEHLYTADGLALFTAADNRGNTSIVSFDPETETCGVVASVTKETEGFDNPVVSSMIFVSKSKPYVHTIIMDSYDTQKFCVKTYNYKTGSEICAPTVEQNAWFTAGRMLENGELLFVGGSYGDNYTGRTDAYIVKPL